MLNDIDGRCVADDRVADVEGTFDDSASSSLAVANETTLPFEYMGRRSRAHRQIERIEDTCAGLQRVSCESEDAVDKGAQ